MLPYIQIGSLTLGTYPLVYAFAFLVGGTVLFFRPARIPIPESIRYKVQIWVVAAIIAGLVIPAAIEAGIRSLVTGAPPEPVVMRVYYGLAVGMLTARLLLRRYGVPLLPAADSSLPAFALAYSIARLGCFAAGCCGGSKAGSAEMLSALAIFMPDEHGHWAMRYPTQLMSSAFQLILFFAMLKLDAAAVKQPRSRLAVPGVITFGYFFLFSLERFSLDFLRADYAPVVGVFSLPQIFMLVGMLGSMEWFIWRFTRRAVT